MAEAERQKCWSPGGAYSRVSWDPDTGCSEIRDYNEDDELIARHEWEIYPEPVGADGVAGEHRTFDAQGIRIATRSISARGG